MDADDVQPEELFLSKTQQPALPSTFSAPADIYGDAVQWHSKPSSWQNAKYWSFFPEIHADLISEATFDDETNTYNCFVIVHDSARTIQLELCSVPDEAVPRLTMFTELVLIGIISGDGEQLQTQNKAHLCFR